MKIKMLVAFLALIIAGLACSYGQSGQQKTTTIQNTPITQKGEESTVQSPPAIQEFPTETSSATVQSASPIQLGLWRFEGSPNISNGLKYYKAYIWMKANGVPITLTHVPLVSAGLPDNDFGLCQTNSNKIAYIETEQGHNYDTGNPTCEFAFENNEGLNLFPGIPVAGKSIYFSWSSFIPYKEKPIQITFPGLGINIALPDIADGPFISSLPVPDTSNLHNFSAPVNVNDTFSVSVTNINVNSLNDKSYLVKVNVRIGNNDKTNNFSFNINRSLIGSDGIELSQVETDTLLYGFLGEQGAISKEECPNYVDNLTHEGSVTIPANSETNTTFCFLMAKELTFPQQITVKIPDTFTFFMTLDNVTLGFNGKPEASN